MNPVDLRLYCIVDPERAGGRGLAEIALAAVRGGCTLVQYRDKRADGRLMVERARAIRAALTGSGVPLLVNDRLDVALAAGADGVHLGQDDIHPNDARKVLGAQAIIGVTVKTTSHADELYRMRADYACIGGVFATASKDNPDPPIGLDGFARTAFRARLASTGIPVGAIAGIDETNAASVIGAGADGIAVIGAVVASPDPEGAARCLRGIVDGALASRGARP
jgi:thiamine-phosphate pyrophosphorylase